MLVLTLSIGLLRAGRRTSPSRRWWRRSTPWPRTASRPRAPPRRPTRRWSPPRRRPRPLDAARDADPRCRPHGVGEPDPRPGRPGRRPPEGARATGGEGACRHRPAHQAPRAPRGVVHDRELQRPGRLHRDNVEQRTRNARDLLVRHDSVWPRSRSSRTRSGSPSTGSRAAPTRHTRAPRPVARRQELHRLAHRHLRPGQGETRPYPYFRGAIRNMPRVLLRHKETGVEFSVTTTTTPRPAAATATPPATGRARSASRPVTPTPWSP